MDITGGGGFLDALRSIEDAKVVLLLDEIQSLLREDAKQLFSALKGIKEKPEDYALFSFSAIGTHAAISQPTELG